jgi:RNA polymerase sigma-70 factor (ECF subfamily)
VRWLNEARMEMLCLSQKAWPSPPTWQYMPMPDNKTADVRPNYSDLVARVAVHQDRHAFMLLFAYFGPRVKAFMMRSGAGDAYAEELAQETLLTVWRKAAAFDPSRASASTWIFTIARNLRIDGVRREKLAVNAQSQLELLEEDVERPDQQFNTVERAERLQSALAGLSPEQLRLVRLSFFEDRPHPEIAKTLNIPLGTVKSRLRRSLMVLREVLEDLK